MKAGRDRLEDRLDLVAVKVSKVLVVAVEMLEFLEQLLFQSVGLGVVVAAAEVQDEGELQKVVVKIVQEIFFEFADVQLFSDEVKEHIVNEVFDIVCVHRDDIRVGREVLKNLD